MSVPAGGVRRGMRGLTQHNVPLSPNPNKPEPYRFEKLSRHSFFGSPFYHWLSELRKKFSVFFTLNSIVNCLGFSRQIQDDFTSYNQELLAGRYDCVDRIVLNGYFPHSCRQGAGIALECNH